LIERGELVQILTSFSKKVTGMYAVYPPGRLLSQRVRVFSDALYAHFLERSI
jgi:DNA-binding transcriptional LysR family regulator